MERKRNITYIDKSEFLKYTSYSYHGRMIYRERTFYRILKKYPNEVDVFHNKKHINIKFIKNYISNYYYKILTNRKVRISNKKFLTVKEFSIISGKSISTIRRFISKNVSKKLNSFTSGHILINKANNRYLISKELMKKFVPESLLNLEFESSKNFSSSINYSMNNFLNKINWSVYATVNFKTIKTKLSCRRKMKLLYEKITKKYDSNDSVLYYVLEPNAYKTDDYHIHFIAYVKGVSKSNIKSFCDNFFRCNNDCLTDIQSYIKNNDGGINYINKTIEWNEDSYDIEYNNPSIFH